jgi:hypothetical protein
VSLLPLKTEIDSLTELLTAGDETPEAMAKAIVSRVYNELLPQRTVYVTAYDLGNSVWVAAGLYPTRSAAFKDAHKVPVAQIAKRALIAALMGPREAATPKEKEQTGDFRLVREDAEAFRAGRKPKV